MNFYKIQVKAKTWTRDSYGLFDYETKEIVRHQFKIDQNGSLVRQGNEIKYFPSKKNDINETANELMRFSEENGNCFVYQDNENSNLWMALSSKLDKKKGSTNLKEGNEIKMGRIVLKILQIKNNKEEKFDQNYKSFMGSLMENFEICQKYKDMVDPEIILSQDTCTEKKICRICLSDYYNDENPLLNPCNCSGTMKYIHYYCLQTWLIKRLDLEKTKGVISILWKSLICELCHTSYPLNMNYKDRTYDLINFFENPDFLYNNDEGNNNNNSTFCNKSKSSLLLKSFTKEGAPNGLHIIELGSSKNNEISIGRGNDCHIRINDISVSRQHCKIIFDGVNVTLIDNFSKFGTLIKIDKTKFYLNTTEKNTYFQVGRTFLEVNLSKKWNFFGICLSCSPQNESYLKEKVLNQEKDQDQK